MMFRASLLAFLAGLSAVHGHTVLMCLLPGTNSITVYGGTYHTGSSIGGMIIAGGVSGNEQYGAVCTKPYGAYSSHVSSGEVPCSATANGAQSWSCGTRFNWQTTSSMTFAQVQAEAPTATCDEVGDASSVSGYLPSSSSITWNKVVIPVTSCGSGVYYSLVSTADACDDVPWMNVWATVQCVAGSLTGTPNGQGTGGGAAMGDPHIKTWAGEMYDFHGVCDLVLLQNPEFEAGHGMDIHIRTKRTRQWSYISSAALRIGDDTLEVMGGQAENNYWMNGAQGKSVSDGMELAATVGGHPVTFRQLSAKSREFSVDLGNDEKIAISTWNGFVRVDVKGATRNSFGNSLGLLGSYGAGLKMDRTGSNVLKDLNTFGQEWQVLSNEPILFHNLEGPQHPEKCEIPSTAEMRRRLAQSSISQEDAELACSRVEEQFREICVFDVMATNDKDAAGAY